MKEDFLQYKLAEWLRENDYLFFHVPNGEKRDKVTAGKLKAMGVLPGVHDLIVLLPGGVSVFIELKILSGVLSDPQKIFRDKIIRMGFQSHLIQRDDIDLAIQDLKTILNHRDNL